MSAKFLLFAGDEYTHGGAFDFRGVFSTLEGLNEALYAIRSTNHHIKWAHYLHMGDDGKITIENLQINR